MDTDELTRRYIVLLTGWNRKINLVHCATLHNALKRHVQDSLQISQFLAKDDHIIDVGSGAGFPGVILAIHGYKDVTLCEKNHKKYTFLLAIKSSLGLELEVSNEDIYKMNVPREAFSKIVLVSRAFGELIKLLDVMQAVGANCGIFHKGAQHLREIENAQRRFSFKYDKQSSVTNKDGVILKIYEVRQKAKQGRDVNDS
ncbi:MAG: 16S rRNA (guanine(527)-N(7))-methyltransferase RsmG [Holosporales bacterium]|jgi:16S rRNA (guanine527-N7)-methyltransferase|nr:16S rRNA (guanine(527)-N(7))-methyltransferase RsmG [Holosporales bacterium]